MTGELSPVADNGCQCPDISIFKETHSAALLLPIAMACSSQGCKGPKCLQVQDAKRSTPVEGPKMSSKDRAACSEALGVLTDSFHLQEFQVLMFQKFF